MGAPDPLHDLLSQTFDADYYRARNPDVVESLQDPLEHFLHVGWREGRDPRPDFSVTTYLDLNPDVAEADLNPFVHWLTTGRAEGRPTRLNLGFRYDILKGQPTLEARLETGRPHDIPPGPAEALAEALGGLGPRLYITVGHDEYVGRTGGVQTCIRREADGAVSRGWSHLHLFPAVPLPVVDFETVDLVLGVVTGEQVCGLFRASDIAEALSRRRAAGAIGEALVGIHSLLGHSVRELTAVLEGAGVERGWFWLHDQSSLCANYLLLRNDVEYCGGPPPDSSACGICIYGQRRRIQLEEHAALFETFELDVLAPSEAMLNHWRARVRYRCRSSRVQPLAALKPTGRLAEPGSDAPFRIGYLGHATDHKGWPLFRELVEAFAEDPRYEFYHLGAEAIENSGCRFIEVDSRSRGGEAMIQAVNACGLDLAFISSLCPETFCFTAREAVAGGAAVAALDSSLAVAAWIESGEPPGFVVGGAAELHDKLRSGAVLAVRRAARRPVLQQLELGPMAAEFMEPCAVGALP